MQWLLREYGFLSETTAPLNSNATTDQLYQTSWFWTITMIILFGLALVMAFKVVHRTEFLADNFAASENHQQLIKIFSGSESAKIVRKPINSITSFLNNITHPSDQDRFRNLASSGFYFLPTDYLYAALWSFSAGLCILFAAFDNYSLFGSWAVFLGDIAAGVGVIILFYCYAASISDFARSTRENSWLNALCLTLIYIIGLSSSIALVLYVDYEAYPQEEVTRGTYINIFLTSATTALMLIYLNCLFLTACRGEPRILYPITILSIPAVFLCGYTLHPNTPLSSVPLFSVSLMFGITLITSLFITGVSALTIGIVRYFGKHLGGVS